MSTPTPTAREQLLEAKARLEVARAEEELARTNRRTRRIQEANVLWDWMSGYQDLIDRLRTDEGRLLLAPSTVNDRLYGANWPFWRTWQEHAILRAQSRFLATENDLAFGALGGLTSYVVGDGYQYRWQAKKGKKPPASLLDRLQEITDEYSKRHDLPSFEQELFKRSRRDGEYFTRDFVDPDDGWRTWTEPVEPEHVLDATGLIDPEGNPIGIDRGAFGIVTMPGNVRRPQYVLVSYDGLAKDEDLVPASEVVHCKISVDSTIKRGLPDFSYSTYEGLKVAGRCIAAMTESAAVQSSVAEILEYESAVASDVQDFVDGEADFQSPNPWTGQNQASRRVVPGESRHIPKGMKYVAPPYSNGLPAWAQAVSMALRRVGVRWNAPEWLVSGDASNNNFASSITAESPFVRRCTRWQSFYKTRFAGNVERAIRNACDAGEVKANGHTWTWAEVQKVCELQAEAPSLTTRNELEEAQCNQIRTAAGVLSPQTWAAQDGLDYDEQQRNIQEHVDRAGKPADLDLGDQPEPATAGGGDDQAGGGDLRATVGGLQAINQLQKDVYAGDLPREAAIANAVLVFGFGAESAERLFPEVEPVATAAADPTPAPALPTLESVLESHGYGDEHWQEACEIDITEAGKRKPGETWQGPSGRWFTINDKGRAVPAKAPGSGEKSKGKKGKEEPAAKQAPSAEEARRRGEAAAESMAPADIQSVADATKTGGFGENKVMISHVFADARKENPDLTMEAFKGRLLDLHRRGEIDLARADMIEAMNVKDVEDSEIQVKHGDRVAATFHFIRVKGGERRLTAPGSTPADLGAPAGPQKKAAGGKPTPEQATAHVEQFAASKEPATSGQIKALGQSLMSLTVPQLQKLKKELGAKAGRKKEELAKGIAARLVEMAGPADAPEVPDEPAPKGGPAARQPEAKPATPAAVKTHVLDGMEDLLAEEYTTTGLVPIHRLRDSVRREFGPEAAKHENFDDLVGDLWREGKLELTAISDLSKATRKELEGAIPGAGNTLFYVERKHDGSYRHRRSRPAEPAPKPEPKAKAAPHDSVKRAATAASDLAGEAARAATAGEPRDGVESSLKALNLPALPKSDVDAVAKELGLKPARTKKATLGQIESHILGRYEMHVGGAG